MSHVEPAWAELQAAFALGSPVLVIGPGCHRMGFDQSEEWQLVVRRVAAVWAAVGPEMENDDLSARRRFLERFWLAQLSEETRHLHDMFREEMEIPPDETSLPEEQNIRDETASPPEGERARIALAVDVLNALINCTRFLGSVIEAGVVPVTDWQRVSARNQDPINELAVAARDDAKHRLEQAAALAGALEAICSGRSEAELSPREHRALTDHRLAASDGASDELVLLKVGAIAAALKALVKSRLGPASGHVSGSVVEWLSDLFWHIVTSGAGVPPSQDELDFYVNLQEHQNDTERWFSRPHPGEYRGSNDGGKALRADLRALLRSYDSGFDQQQRDWSKPRLRFSRTMAASLVENWKADHEQRLVVALVSDYDVMLERSIMEILEDGEGFHVLVPALVEPDRTKDQARFEWLYGTYERRSTRGGKSLASPNWQWFAATPANADEPPRGPIVVRLAGSPLYDLGTVSDLGLGGEDSNYEGHENLVAGAVYSEHESVRAVMALTKSAPVQPGVSPPRYLDSDLFGPNGLTWEWRSWLFFGHRFSDWLPRLRLLFTALWLAQDVKQPFKRALSARIAVDRTFDWPEQALLRALEIEMMPADLTRVSRYFDPETSHHTSGNKPVTTFLKQVEETSQAGIDAESPA